MAGGDDLFLDHAEFDGVHFEGCFKVAFEGSAHAFEDDEIGVLGGVVDGLGDLAEVDEGGGAARVEGGEAVGLDELVEGGIEGLEAGEELDEFVVGDVVEGGEVVGGDEDACAALGEEAAEGQDAEDEIGAGVVGEEEGLFVGGAVEEAVGHGVVVVDEPGAFAAEVVADLDEVGGGVGEHFGGGAGAQVEDVAGEDAFGGEEEGFIFGTVGIEFGDDFGIEGEHGGVFAGLHFFKGVGDAVGDELLLAHEVEGVEVKRAAGGRGGPRRA